MSELTTTFDNESFIDSQLNVNENITSILNNEESMENNLDAVNQIASELNSDSSMKSILDEPFVHRYDGKETDNIDVFVDNENYKISASLKQIRFATLNDFPDVGSDRLIYIADDTKILYGWGTNGYFPLSAGGSNDVDLSNYYTKQETYSRQQIDDKLANLDVDIDFSNYYTKTQTNNLLSGKADKNEIPDVSGFITKSVNDLVNYYTKSQTYTQEEINTRISAIPKFDIQVVTSLPTSGISSTTIYLLKTSTTETGNLYTEYIYTNGAWESLGTQTIDLSDYVTNYDLNYAISVALTSYYTMAEINAKLSAKQDKISSTNMIKSDYIDDNAQTHKFVTAEEKGIWNNKSDFSGDYNDLTNKPTIPTLPDTSNFVTTNTEQTITALKTFKQGNSTNYVTLGVDIDNTPALQVGFDGFGRFQKFQDKSGTIALLEDIESFGGVDILPVGAIFASAIPQTDARVHLLDGSTILQSGVYETFANLIKSLVASGYNISCSETEFNNDVNKTGNCGKFVIDNTNNTIRLPKITMFIQGLTNITNIGTSIEAGLPDITHTHPQYITANSGAYMGRQDYSGDRSSSDIYPHVDTGVNSSVSSIYGKSDTVQPNATQYPYYIVLANGYKSSNVVNFDNILGELNNKQDKLNIIQLYYKSTSDTSYSANSVHFPTLLIKNYTGNKLSLSNNGILIGSGVSKIKVSGYLNYWASSGGKTVMYLNKNGTSVLNVENQIGASISTLSSFPNYIVDVSEGDLIQLGFSCTSSGYMWAGTDRFYLTAEVIE